MKKTWAIAAAALSLTAGGLVSPGAASAAVASPFVVNFTADTTGAKANGFSSPGIPQVSFYSTAGSGLGVEDYANQSHGNALANFGTGLVEIRLSAPTNAISLAFGNDDPALSNTSDLARLTLYRGVAQVGQVDVNFNANDDMDQTIGISGQGLFNRATFQYVDAVGVAKAITEIVDDITLNPLCTITGTPGNNHLVGTAGNDVICGDAGADTIKGGGGDDLIYGGSGKDHIVAGKGKDVSYGGSGKDKMSGGKGKDQLYGGTGRDSLSGGTGRDLLSGGKGKDHCDGGKGHDSSTSCEIRSSIP